MTHPCHNLKQDEAVSNQIEHVRSRNIYSPGRLEGFKSSVDRKRTLLDA